MATSHPTQSPGIRPRNITAGKWMRFLLHLIPLGAIVGAAALVHFLTPFLGVGISVILAIALVIIVTLAAGASNSILAWRQLDGPGLPKVSAIIADTIAFVFIVFFIILAIGTTFSVVASLINILT